MKHAYSNDLDQVFSTVWSTMEAAPGDRQDPWRLPTIGSVHPETLVPELRTVVLRACHPVRRQLVFHTDARSSKVAALRDNPLLGWCFWNRREVTQVRLVSRAKLHIDDAVSEEYWGWTAASERSGYCVATAPGQVLAAPPDEMNSETERLTPMDQVRARDHFCLVVCTVMEVDWLHLGPRGHRRAESLWDRGSDKWIHRWLQP